MDECNKNLYEDEKVSRSTISRRLRENGLHGRIAVKSHYCIREMLLTSYKFCKSAQGLGSRAVDESNLNRRVKKLKSSGRQVGSLKSVDQMKDIIQSSGPNNKVWWMKYSRFRML